MKRDKAFIIKHKKGYWRSGFTVNDTNKVYQILKKLNIKIYDN